MDTLMMAMIRALVVHHGTPTHTAVPGTSHSIVVEYITSGTHHVDRTALHHSSETASQGGRTCILASDELESVHMMGHQHYVIMLVVTVAAHCEQY